MKHCLQTRVRFAVAPLAMAAALAWAVPLETPEQFAGFRMGADKKLVRWDRIVEYMHKAAAASPRIKVDELGKTTEGNPFIVVTVSSPENLANLAYYRDAQTTPHLCARPGRRRGRPPARAAEGHRADHLQHALPEIGSSQMALELVHRFATEDSRYIRRILDNVILLLVPSLNPDGQILVTDWYNNNLGTPYESPASLPELYHKYTGHDNNRDAFMNTQVESRLINHLTYKEWLPHVFYDQHQTSSQRGAHLRAAVQGPDQSQRRSGSLGAERRVRL